MRTSLPPQTTLHLANRLVRRFLPTACAIPLALAALICSGGFSGCTRQAEPPRLAEAGSARYDIAVAADAAAVEQTAAQELQSYLKKITGADFSIVAADAARSKPVIAVGPGAALAVSPTLDLSKTELGDDGIVLKTVDKNLILTGATGAKRGTLYAVNEFLSKQAGVRWWTPEAETVPANPDLALQPIDVRYRPAIRVRDAYSNSFARLTQDGSEIARDTLVFPLFHEMQWPEAKVKVRWRDGKARFTCDNFAWRVCVDLDGDLPLGDNFFDILPGVPVEMPWREEWGKPKIRHFGNRLAGLTR